MTDLEYLLYIEGHRTTAYTDGHDAIHDAALAKQRDPDAAVVLCVVTREDADMSAEDFRVRPFAVSPDEQAARVVSLTETEREPGEGVESRPSIAASHRDEPAWIATATGDSTRHAFAPRSVSARANRRTR